MKNDRLINLYRYAEQHGHDVYWFSLNDDRVECLSEPYADGTGSCAIAIDPLKLQSLSDEYCKLSHEIGHCETGAFYNKYATCDVRQKHENTADRWSIMHTLTASDLDQAVADGYADIWSLAEYFDVTPDFMRKALCLYIYDNLDCADYLPV